MRTLIEISQVEKVPTVMFQRVVSRQYFVHNGHFRDQRLQVLVRTVPVVHIREIAEPQPHIQTFLVDILEDVRVPLGAIEARAEAQSEHGFAAVGAVVIEHFGQRYIHKEARGKY